MKLFEKKFEDIDEKDLKKMEADPMNFESLQIEYKIKFDGDAAELQRDFVQFANGFEEGYIFFGISDDPITVVGIEKSEVDRLKTVLNDVLLKRIDPILSPFPQYQTIPLTSGKYVFIIKISPKEDGIYGIRQSDDMNNRNYYRYEFYKRMDGNKHRMNIESIVDLIESKSRKKWRDKFLDVELRKSGYFLIAKAVNKSERPIVVTHYRFLFPLYSIGSGLDVPYEEISEKNSLGIFEMPPGILRDAIEKTLEEIKSAPPPFRDLMIDPEINKYPIKLKDGESLSESLDIISFMDRILRYYEERDFNTEVVNDLSNIKCCFYTNDGEFYSDTIEIESDVKEILKSKQEKNFTMDELFEGKPPKVFRKLNKKVKKEKKKS